MHNRHNCRNGAAGPVAALFLVLLAGAAGCGSDQSGPASQSAKVRLLQADPAMQQAVDLAIDDAVVAQGVAFGQSSPEVATTAGRHRFSIRNGAATGASYEGEVLAGAAYYVVSAGGKLFLAASAALDSTAAPDTGQRNPLRANVRLVNVPGPDLPPALVTAFLSAPATVDTTQRFGIDTRIARYGTLMYLDPGTITVRFRPTGEQTVLTEVAFEVLAGGVKAVVLERDSAGVLHARVVTEQ